MGKSIGSLVFNFGANLSGFDRAMKKAQQKIKKFGKSMQKAGSTMTRNLTLPLLGFAAVSIKAFDEQQKAIAQVEAGLKSTGNQVGITSEKLQQMASDLQKTTLFGDEEILQGATAQLLTFTNIVGKQFAKTQEIVLDLATRLDGDLKSAAIMLGKALNDPVANLSALSRAGIQFTTEQKNTIKSLVETNRLADAQTIILKELEKQYGGSARAAAEAGMGPIQQLQNRFLDISETIGERLIPHVKKLAEWITGIAEKFDKLSPKQKDNIVKWGLIIGAIGPLLLVLGQMSFALLGLTKAFGFLKIAIMANPIGALAAIVATAAAAFITYKWGVLGASDANDQFGESAETVREKIERISKLADNIGKSQMDLSIAEVTKEIKKLKKEMDVDPKFMKDMADLWGAKTGKTGRFELKGQSKELQDLLDLRKKLIKARKESNKVGKTGKTIIEEETEEISKLTTQYDGLVNMMGKHLDKIRQYSPADIEEVVTWTVELGLARNAVEEFAEAWSEMGEKVQLSLDGIAGITDAFNKKMTIQAENQNKIKTEAIDEEYEKQKEIIEKSGRSEEEKEAMLADLDKTTNEARVKLEEETASKLAKIKRRQAIQNKAMAIADVIINTASSIMKVMGQAGIFGIPMTFLVAGMGAAQLGIIASTPLPLKEGGLVTGPTTALIGEAGPEAVIPLNKLNQFMGGGSQNIVVTGKIIGNDIFLSNAKTSINRLRTV